MWCTLCIIKRVYKCTETYNVTTTTTNTTTAAAAGTATATTTTTMCAEHSCTSEWVWRSGSRVCRYCDTASFPTLHWVHFVGCLSQRHYYQPMLTLVGGGLRSLSEAHRPMKEVLSSSCEWIQDAAIAFDPANSQLTTRTGFMVRYTQCVYLTHGCSKSN